MTTRKALAVETSRALTSSGHLNRIHKLAITRLLDVQWKEDHS